MTKKKRAGFARGFLRLALIAPAILGIASQLCSMARLEIRMARKRMVWFFLLGMLCLVLMLGAWSSLCWVMCFYLLSIKLSLLQSMVIVFIFNICLLVIACLCFALFRIDLTFPKTRRDIRKLVGKD